MLEPTSELSAVKPMISKARKDLRNLIARVRSKTADADRIRMIGAFEVDWYPTYHIPRLSGYKRGQIESIGFDFSASEIWLPHLHVIMGGVSAVTDTSMRNMLERKYRGSRRVDIAPLDRRRPLDESFRQMMSYTVKCKHAYDIDPFRADNKARIAWPVHVIAKFHEMVAVSGGFQMMKFHLRSVNIPGNRDSDDSVIDDAMPSVIGISQNPYFLI